MPDFNSKIKKYQENQNEIKDQPTDDISKVDELLGLKNNQQEQEPGEKEYDLSGIGYANDEEAKKRAVDTIQSEDRFSGFNDVNQDRFVDPNSWSPNYVNESLLTNTGKNIMFGVGQMIGDYGDIAQVLGSTLPGIDMYEGNIVSRFLQDIGKDIQDQNTTYIPPEVLDPKFKFSTFADPKFWSTHGARFIPQLLEIIGTVGLASLAKKGVQSGLKYAFKEALEEGAESALKKSLRTTTKNVYQGAKGIEEVTGTGKGILGKIMTDRGQLTKTFGDMVQNVSGGLITNLRVSLANSGEVYNTYKDLKDEQGNAIFSKEELSQMASSTFLNNMQYVGMDILSWGLVYGKGWNMMNKMGIGKMKNKFGDAIQRKYMSSMFTNSVSPLFSKIGKLGAKMGTEAIEEMIQESWEEWSKVRAYKEVNGNVDGYQSKLSKNYDNSLSGFWDFFMSNENEATRTISFALGAMGAGAFNVKTLIDRNADESYKMKNRAENLKTIFDKGSEGKTWQDYHIRSQMAELVFENKGESFVDFITDLKSKDIVTDEDVQYYGNLFDQMANVKDNISHLNIKGKKALMTNIMKNKFFNDSIEIEKSKTAKNIEILKTNLEDEKLQKAIDNENKILKEKLVPLSDMVFKTDSNIKSLLSNEKANDIPFDVKTNEDGSETILSEQKTNETGETKPVVQKETSLSEKAKNILNKALTSVSDIFSPKQENNQKEPIEQMSDGAIDNLKENTNVQEFASKLNIGDPININGKNANVTSINKNADETIDSFDYEIEQDTNSEIELSPEEKKKTARLTKNNTFFDDRKNEVLNISTIQNQGQKVIPNDSAQTLSDPIYNNFVDNGEIPSGIINMISDKISKNEPLTDKEISIQKEFGNEIENNLQEKKKLEDEMQSEIEKESETEEEANYIKEAVLRKPTKKTLKDDDAEFKKLLKEKTYKKQDEKIDNIFGNEKRFDAIKTLKDIIDYNKNTFKKQSSFFNKLSSIAKNYIPSFNSFLNNNKNPEDDHFVVSQMMAINEKLETMFPEIKPRVYEINKLNESIGRPAVGYSLAGSIYIDENSWNQDSVFMHEMSHVYFGLTKDLPETKVLLNHALKNNELVNKVMDLYEDEIEYRDPSDGVVIKRKHLFGEQWNSLSKEERDSKINELIENGYLQNVPLNEQSIIAEEVFANTLEGPLSKKYNKYFDPKNDIKRQFFAKRWWKAIKDRAVNSKNSFLYNETKFLQTLNNNEKEQFNNAKDFIIEKFKESTKGKDLSPIGRAKIIEENQSEIKNDILEIKDRIKKSIDENLNNEPLKNDFADKETSDDFDEFVENNNYENLYEISRLKYVKKASKLIRDFSQAYNKVLRKRYYNANKNKPTNWKNIPVFDKDLLQVKLFEIARTSYSSPDFIRRLENTSIDEVYEFNQFLSKTKNDKEMFLQSMYWIFKNQSNINGLTSYIDKYGNHTIQNSLNNKEIAITDNILDKVIKSVGSYYMDTKGQTVSKYYLDKFNEYLQSSNAIKSGNYTDEDLFNVLKFFSNKTIDVKNLFKENRININGKNFTVDTAVRAFLMSEKGMKNNSVYEYSNNGKYIKPGVRTFIQSIVSTNRKFTAEYTIQNAEGNQEPIKIIDNFLTREFDKITEDAKRLGKNKFIEKYAHISSKLKDGSRSNQILNFIYDNIQDDKQISLNQFHGIKNDNTGDSSVTKNSNSSEQSINEMLMYLSTSKGKTSYLMETGRFSDSPRSFILEVPKIKLNEVGNYNGSQFVFNPKNKAFLNTAYNIYKGLGNDISFDEFKNILNNDIQEEIDFIENNSKSTLRIPKLKEFLNSDGRLNNKGKNLISEYVINQSLNGIYFNEIFFPSFPIKDRDKRAKSGTSPGFAFGKHVQLEPIYFVDDYLYKKDNDGNIIDQNEVTDAGIYVLEEDAKRLEKAGGNIMPLGKGYKILLTGIEHDNSNFKGKNLYDKGFATILNDKVIEDNPKLKGLYELMKSRREMYIERNGNIEEDLLSGIPTHFLYASPLSANKSNNLPSALTKKESGIDIPTDIGNALTLENLNKSKDFKDVHSIYDKWYYDNDDFIGISGDNFVVQQIMDKENYESNTPIQMVRALITNASITGKIKETEQMQRLIMEMQQDNLSEYEQILKEGTSSEIRELLVDQMNLDQMDPLQSFLIKDGLSLNTPALREIARNTLSNLIKRNGNKLKTPGTVAQQKPAMYQKKYGITNGSKGLAFYSEKSDGSLIKGEAIAPKYLESKLRKRESFTIKDKRFNQGGNLEERLSIIEAHAKKISLSRNVGYGPIYSEQGTKIGYYVEGDTIIATRIPAHGPQSTGVFEVIDFDQTGGSQTQLPYEFAGYTTGGDFDGDQVFIQHKGRGPKWSKWNQVLSEIEKHWLSPEMKNEVRLGIEITEDAENAIKEINKVYNGKNKSAKSTLHFSPRGRRISYNNTLISKGNIGITANLHGLIGMLSAYNISIKTPITINKKKIESFSDNEAESRSINSAKLFNIILDNAKHGFADALGLNEHTVSQAMILRNLGYSLNEIGVILNSPVVESWVDIMSNKENVFSGPQSIDNIESLIRNKLKLKKPKTTDYNIDTKNILSDESMNSTLSLMSYLSSMTDEINSISKILSGHKELETNPFIMEQQIKRFNDVLSNTDNVGLIINDNFRNNPLIKNYKSVAEINLNDQRKFDPVFRKDGAFVYDKIISGSLKNLNKKEQRQLHDDIEVFYTSRLLGLNNIPEEYMTKLISQKSDSNIFDRLNLYKDSLNQDIIKKDEKNILNSITAAENNLLLSKGLRYSFKGNNQFISLNSNFFNENMSAEERNRVVDEFNELPVELKNDLMIYDLMTRGWKGPQSLFHLFDIDLKSLISSYANFDIENKDRKQLSLFQKDLLLKRLIDKNPEFFSLTTKKPLYQNKEGKRRLNLNIPKRILDNISKGNETMFRYKSEKGSQYIIHFKGWENDQIAELKSAKNSKDLLGKIGILAPKQISIYTPNQYKNKIGLISIPDENTGNPFYYNDVDSFIGNSSVSWEERISRAKKLTEKDIEGREARSDYYRFYETLSRNQFDKVMQFDDNVLDPQREIIYENYLKEKRQADKVYQTLNEETVKKENTQDLLKKYEEYGTKNKFAYSNVLRAITLELTNRAANEQSKLTGRYYDGKDINYLQSWLMSNNIPSNHPAVQSLVRNLEQQYKKYLKERNKYISNINKATDNLYKEKFGFTINSGKPIDMLKSVYFGIFNNREKFYEELYGNLIEIEKIPTKTGIIKNMKYKSSEEIENGFKKGIISQAEYDFYKTTTGIMEEMRPFVLEEKSGRTDYIPHTAPDMMEKLWRRGLLGLAVNSKAIDQRIFDVKMNVKNPITGKDEKNISFKQIHDWYNTISKHKNVPIEKSGEYLKLKKKAHSLVKKGINEDGSSLRFSEIEMGSAIGDVFLDRFSKSRSIKATDFPSMDLNKAFIDYLDSALFIHGNSEFNGMKKMLPYVDGVLAQADRNGDKNMANYVDKIWKQYFLSGKKQHTLPTPSALASIGLSSDKVVDYITKGSLIYWLGWKGLAIGGGAYAIGNVLVGKYHNIKNAGKEAWKKGEARFWKGKTGEFNLNDPFKGMKEAVDILHKTGFMDINVYDDVNVQSKTSLDKMLSNIALAPMIYSEKWIQGVHFLGLLTDQEWDVLSSGGTISENRLIELENEVKESHGKGYQATDQRMIQMYSWGRSMMQFSRYLPTMFYDRLAGEDINIYGQKHIGSYRATWRVIQKMATGQMKPKEFAMYRNKLDAEEKKRLDSGLIGFGLMSTLIAINTFVPTKTGQGLFWDANAIFDFDKLSYKTTPPSINMFDSIF